MKRRILNLKLYNPSPQSIKKKDQAYILKTLAELLREGFSIQQALQFLIILMPNYRELFQQMEQQLATGNPIEKGLHQIGYSVRIMAHLFYAQQQGRFIESLFEASDQLAIQQKYVQKLLKTLGYPIFLGILLIGMLFAMRQYILPHILSFISEEVYNENFLVRLLVTFFNDLPQIFLIIVAVILISYGAVDYWLLKKDALTRYRFVQRVPVIKQWSRLYATYAFTYQLAYFYKGGYSLKQIVYVITQYPVDPFLDEIAQIMQEEMLLGEDLVNIINKIDLFTQELPLIMYQGELTHQMGQKLSLYSEKIFNDLLQDVERKISYIQPLLFILIAILVVGMYLMMMLPMLTMDGF